MAIVEQNSGFEIYSRTLKRFFEDLDSKIFCMEEAIEKRDAKIKELEETINKRNYEDYISSQLATAGILTALVGTPDVSQISPSMAVMLRKIRDIGSIGDVHSYIDGIFKSGLEQLSSKEEK